MGSTLLQRRFLFFFVHGRPRAELDGRRAPLMADPGAGQSIDPSLRARLPRAARTRTARRLRAGTAAVTAFLTAGLVLLHDWGPGPHVLSGVRPAVKRALNALYGVDGNDAHAVVSDGDKRRG